jgi:hypothetical protein
MNTTSGVATIEPNWAPALKNPPADARVAAGKSAAIALMPAV